ncbi:MAG TPA: hypothetical protein VEX86_28315 [Longimicrobium sp.]|nr:hypothetical protein [Longimicrobium sp.]
MALITARAWNDPGYRKRLVGSPEAVLRDEGVHLPADVSVAVLEDTPRVKHVTLDDGAPDGQAARLLSHLPIAEGRELRVVHSGGRTRYLVLPVPPAGALLASAKGEPDTQPGYQLLNVTAQVVTVTSIEAQQVELVEIDTQISEVAVETVVEVTTISEGQVMDSQAIEVATVSIEGTEVEIV